MRRYLISQHPEVEKKLVEELDKNGFLATAGQPKPVRMQYSDLSKLTYLSWVCKVCCLLPLASSRPLLRLEACLGATWGHCPGSSGLNKRDGFQAELDHHATYACGLATAAKVMHVIARPAA